MPLCMGSAAMRSVLHWEDVDPVQLHRAHAKGEGHVRPITGILSENATAGHDVTERIQLDWHKEHGTVAQSRWITQSAVGR